MSQIIHGIGDDPFVITDDKAAALYGEIHHELSKLDTQAWPALQARTSELIREANGGISQMSRLKDDVERPNEVRGAAFDTVFSATMTKVTSLRKDIDATLQILQAEVVSKARPRVSAERELYVRQDVDRLLDTASDPLRRMVDIAGGQHRDRAALVVSDYIDARLEQLFRDRSERQRFRDGLTTAMITGAIKHGSPAEQAHARAARETLPKVQGWVATRVVPAMARLNDARALRP